MLTRALFIIAAIVTTSVAMATPVLTLSAQPETYVPGAPFEVTITVTSNIADNVSALGFTLWAPPAGNAIITGFSVEPDGPYYEAYSAEGFWYNLGSPKQAKVMILPAANMTGDIVITGRLSWFEGSNDTLHHGEYVSLTIPQYIIPVHYHTADTGVETGTPDEMVDLSELLRVIQLYNSRGYHCADTNTEDGYVPGLAGARGCEPHDADYMPQDWMISLDELLRVIQFYNSLGYHYCPDQHTEDGFCAGP